MEMQPDHHSDYNQNVTNIVQNNEYMSVFPKHYSIKIHNKKSAFEIKPSRTQNGFQTVSIESALALPGYTNPIKYDWNNKIIFQITKNELAELAMVLLGMKKRVEFKNHKIGNAIKSLSIEFQGDGFFTNINMHDNLNKNNSKYCSLKLPTIEALSCGHVALVQYCQNFPSLTTDSALKTFEYMAKRQISYKKSKG